jgi:hypothetical protein
MGLRKIRQPSVSGSIDRGKFNAVGYLKNMYILFISERQI